jgi:hypothetical protein
VAGIVNFVSYIKAYTHTYILILEDKSCGKIIGKAEETPAAYCATPLYTVAQRAGTDVVFGGETHPSATICFWAINF